MSVSKQIGWGTEAKLLYEILKEIKMLRSVLGSTTTTTSTSSTTTTTTTAAPTTTTTTTLV